MRTYVIKFKQSLLSNNKITKMNKLKIIQKKNANQTHFNRFIVYSSNNCVKFSILVKKNDKQNNQSENGLNNLYLNVLMREIDTDGLFCQVNPCHGNCI